MNRRGFELVIIAVVAVHVVMGAVRVWSHKTFASTSPGSPAHVAAEAASIIS